MASNPLVRNATRKTARPWWVALETMKELENCLKKLDSGVSRKHRHWATQQKAEEVRVRESAETSLAKPAAGVFRRGDENTLVGVAVDGKSFRQKGRTADVCMELGGNRAGGVDLTR